MEKLKTVKQFPLYKILFAFKDSQMKAVFPQDIQILG